MGGEKPGPISGRHDDSTILCTNQLAEITCRILLDYTSQVIQRADIGMVKRPLDEVKPHIGGKIGVASDHEMQLDGVVQTCEDSQHQVLHHGVVFILATAVVNMQTEVALPRP